MLFWHLWQVEKSGAMKRMTHSSMKTDTAEVMPPADF